VVAGKLERMTEREDRVIRTDVAGVAGTAREVLSRTPETNGSVPASHHADHVMIREVDYTSTLHTVTALPSDTWSC